MTASTYKNLLRLQIKLDSDVVLARRRARQIALLLGFNSQDQTRVSTAVSEIARNALVYAGGGQLDFCIADSITPYKLIVTLEDKGPGIENIEQILSGNSEHFGLLGASRLVDKLTAINLESGGTAVQIEKELSQRNKPFSSTELNELANSLTKLVASSPIDEVHQQNQELLAALDQLSQKQAELDQANNELANKNLHLSELNQEMHLLNNSLEAKVKARTKELQESNAHLSAARDEAILANKLKSQFVANISHEIRTPMSGILGTTELVLESYELDPDAEALLRMSHESALGLMSIINDLLDFAKLEAGKPHVEESDFYIASIIDEAIHSISGVANKKGLPVHKLIANSLNNLLLSGDPMLLKRVFLNLLHNAVKFTTTGEVRIEVAIAEQKNDTIRIKSTVSDTGIGISAADKGRLFQPFVQADGSNTRIYGGTGLGLSISKGYVDLMHGLIDFESTEHQGSTFWFEVPLRIAPA